MFETLKSIEDEIKRLQQKIYYADFISDLISVITRDIAGGALELQYKKQGESDPLFCYFRYACAYQLPVIEAARKTFRTLSEFTRM